VHRDRLDTADHMKVHGIPVTRIARTVVDLDRVLDDQAFDRLVRDAMYRRRFHDTRVRDALTRKRSSRRLGYLHDHNLIVEVDGWLAHGTRNALQRDRTTTNALQLAGYTVLRFTEQDLTDRPRTVATQTRRALAPTPAAASRAASSPHPGR
jgi:very-short-patch-repair endonuclease